MRALDAHFMLVPIVTMAAPSFPYSSYRKPLTPDRVSRYRQYRQDPASCLVPLPAPEPSFAFSRPSFLTHASSRVYPLTVLGHSRPQSVDTRATASRQASRHMPKPKPDEPGDLHRSYELNMSLDSSAANYIPRVEYQQYKRGHQLRHNDTTPGRRDLNEYMGENESVPLSKRFYKPHVVKITPRSKIILHSSLPMAVSVPLRIPVRPVRKDSLGAPVVEADVYESPDKASSDSLPSDDSPALTFADKLAKLRRLSDNMPE